MALRAPQLAPPDLPPPAAGPARRRLSPEAAVVAAVAGAAIVLAFISHAHHLQALPDLARGTAAALVLFVVCGEAASRLLIPSSWGRFRVLLALPLGAAFSALALTALGIAGVPLKVSELVVLGLGVAASLELRRRERRSSAVRGADLAGVAASASSGTRRLALVPWLLLGFLLLCVALIPAWRLGLDTTYGINPDAHQVVGIAVLFQHVPPTHTDDALPIDVVPSAWSFRYPIFYGLAAASNLAHQDPILVFPAIAALLLVIAALGFAAVAVRCLELPPAAGLVTASGVGLWPIALHLGWHPYWNQLWGLAMLPYPLLFGWRGLVERDRRLLVLCALMLVTLWLAYPLALPYPLVVLAALALALRGRPRLPRVRGKAIIVVVLGAFILLPAVAGAAVKLAQGISQLVSPGSQLWSGDIVTPLPIGLFAGTGGGLVAVAAVLALALLGVLALPRRLGWALGLVLAALCLLDLRFRLTSGGAYMDFKHLSFVAPLLLTVAVAGAWRLLAGRGAVVLALVCVLGGAWLVAAVVQDRTQAITTGPQVTPSLFAIRAWARSLPAGSSVRVDIPPSGLQLWAVYMLGDHPVDSPTPLLHTTYAHAPRGERADYSLSLTRYPAGVPDTGRPFPRPLYAQNPPLASNDQFVLRRIAWPPRYRSVPDNASTALVEP